jgi:K+-transporting ATPase ATPase C chain
MRRDLLTSLIAVVLMTLVFGVAYPLAFTGVAQVLFPGKADGSQITKDGKLVGSSLIAQKFTRRVPVPGTQGRKTQRVADPRYFQPRPSQTNWDPSVTYFSNLGPNSKDARDTVKGNLAAYLALEGRFDRGLTADDVPIDAVTQSASGVDPHISEANARIQAHRIAAVRRLPLARVEELISGHTDGRFLGLFGEPGVNVLELNIALDEESSTA